MVLLFVLIAVRLDLLMGTSYLRNTVCVAFIANEAVSIVENAGLMGVPIPEVICKTIEVLEKKGKVLKEVICRNKNRREDSFRETSSGLLTVKEARL